MANGAEPGTFTFIPWHLIPWLNLRNCLQAAQLWWVFGDDCCQFSIKSYNDCCQFSIKSYNVGTQ